MSDPSCPRCGAPLPPATPPGACPSCLLRLGLEADAEVVHTRAGGDAPEPPTAEELAALFPQLEVVATLGRGGMGAVYRARQRGLDRDVALKILLVRPEDRASFAERFAREARALARLSHPAIVGVHDFGVAGDWYYLTMEYVDGASLRQLMRSGELRPRQALDVVGQICEALQFAHEEGVVHRDIKPENILVDRRGRVKIADFGLAKMARQPGARTLTGTFQAMGTPHYMAPEQYERPLEVDHRADIYSLGVMFYELLTGELPVGAFDPPSKKVRVDVRLDDVVLKAMRREPDRRYQHASEVGTDVGAIAASGEPPATDWKAHHEERRDARRVAHRKRGGGMKVLAWVGCLGLALLPGLAVLLFLGTAMFMASSSEAEPFIYSITPAPAGADPRRTAMPHPAEQPTPPAEPPAHTTTCAEIDAAGERGGVLDQLSALEAIGRRGDLNPHERRHLVHALLDVAGPARFQAQALRALADTHPADVGVEAYAREAIQRLPDAAQRRHLLQALDVERAAPPPAGGDGGTSADAQPAEDPGS